MICTHFCFGFKPNAEAPFIRRCSAFVSAEVALCAWPYMTFVVYPLLFDEYGWIRLEVWCALLSNAQRIRVDQVILCERIFDDLYTFLLRFQAKRRGAIHSSMQRRSSAAAATSHHHHGNKHSKFKQYKARNNTDSLAAAKYLSELSLTHIRLTNIDEKEVGGAHCLSKYQLAFEDIGWLWTYEASAHQLTLRQKM
mmetsp:Transcript_909/g.1743  ORF Transcript_909/g.1743 Transcript_909/m.1743 type:complete len:196 (+) Transcript_909:503-1090(+)